MLKFRALILGCTFFGSMITVPCFALTLSAGAAYSCTAENSYGSNSEYCPANLSLDSGSTTELSTPTTSGVKCFYDCTAGSVEVKFAITSLGNFDMVQGYDSSGTQTCGFTTTSSLYDQSEELESCGYVSGTTLNMPS